MSEPLFPKLKTGAIAQYPLRRTLSFRTEVLTFVDGSEQRVALKDGPARSWQLKFQGITPSEAANLERLYENTQGGTQLLTLEDPFDGTTREHCSFAGDGLRIDWVAEGSLEAAVTIEENKA